jgi:hypothetical protein
MLNVDRQVVDVVPAQFVLDAFLVAYEDDLEIEFTGGVYGSGNDLFRGAIPAHGIYGNLHGPR